MIWRWLIAFVCLLFVAVASSYLVGEKGYVLIAMGNWTIESTVVGSIILLTAVFMLYWLVKKIISAGFNISTLGWTKLGLAGKSRANKQFHQAVASYLLGDYPQAEQLLQKSAFKSQTPQIALLLAADSASKQHLSGNVEHYLNQLAKLRQSQPSARLLAVECKLLQQAQKYQQVRILLDKYHTLIGHDPELALIEVQQLIQEQHFAQAVTAIISLFKQKKVNPPLLAQLESQSFFGWFNQLITQQDSQALLQAWQQLANKVKQRSTVLISYIKVLSQHHLAKPLIDVLAPVLKRQPSNEFLLQLRPISLEHNPELLALIQQQLHHQAENYYWLTLLAHVAWQQQDITLAAKAFDKIEQQMPEKLDSYDRQIYSQVLLQKQQYQHAVAILLEK